MEKKTTGNVQEVIAKSGRYSITIDGVKYSTFDEQLGKSIQKGQRITITYIDNKASTGITYHNIKTLQIEKAQAHDFESKKYRAMCLSYAKDLAVAGNTSIKNMLSLAKDMYEWVIK